MAEHYLATYLNDHRAGAEAGLELLGHVERTHRGTPVGEFAAELRADVAADCRELEGVMARLGVTMSIPRKVAGWFADKMAALKLHLDDPAGGALRLLELLEGLSLGIEGKRLLWRSLSAAAESRPELRGPDYGRLVQRAEEQRRAVELVRLEAAKAALGCPHAVTSP